MPIKLVTVLIAALTLRLGLLFSHHGLLGVDGGAYLDTVNHYLYGYDWAGFPRPPLAPGILLSPFIDLFGIEAGYKVWSAIFSLTPVIPVYLLVRRFINADVAIFAAVFAALDLSWAEMMVTGALPLFGFALIGLCCWGVASIGQRPGDNIAKTVLAISIGLIPWVNQTSSGLAVIILPLFCVALWYFSDKEARQNLLSGDTGFPITVGILMALPSFPWYLAVSPGSFTYPDDPFIYLARATHFVWIQTFIIALPLGIFTLWKGNHPAIRSMGVFLVLMGLMAPWLANDEAIINIFYRTRYLMALPFYICVSWLLQSFAFTWIKQKQRGRAILGGAIGAALALMIGGFVYIFNLQTFYSDQITPPAMAALADLHEISPNEGIATNTFSMSVWVGALNHVPSPWVFDYRPPDQYTRQYADLRCVLNWADGCDPQQAASNLDIGYILVDTKFPDLNGLRNREHYLAPANKWGRTDEATWLQKRMDRDGVIVWQIAR